MAFSKSVKKGQIPVNCKLCETDNKITSKCIDCNMLMCSKCKDVIHPKIAKNHRVVDIKDVGPDTATMDLQEMDLSNKKCRVHSGQIYCLFCKSCDQLVCPLCITEVHHGHGLVQIKEGYDIQIKKLEPIEKKISENLNKINEIEVKIKEIQKTEKSKYEDAKNRIQEQNVALKKAVDEYTKDLLQKLDQSWTDLENSISKQKQKADTQHKLLKEKKALIQNMRKSKDTGKVFSQSGNLVTSDNEPLELRFDSMPVFTPGEISQCNFGELYQSPSTAINIDILHSFNTKLGMVGHISVNPDDSLWINNSKQELLQKVKPKGGKLSIISSYNVKVYDMALTPSNDILLATGKSTLQMISGGQLKDTYYTVSPLLSISVHVTSQKKVMVGGVKGGKGAVIVMDMEGKHENKYQHDRNGESLFTYPKQITSTRNRNIFVIDEISDDDRRVVILQQTGDVVNIYRGHHHVNDDKRMFKPGRMTCTPSDNVIIIDLKSDIIHILNNTGYLIKYHNMRDIGILHTLSLAFSRPGKLYIGCSKSAGSKENNAKIYEVNISGD